MLSLGGTITIGMAFGAVNAASDADGVTPADALRLAIMGLLVLGFIGQFSSIVRFLPGARWLGGRLFRAGVSPVWSPPPMLDQVGARQLMRQATEGFGVPSTAQLLGAGGRRALDLGSWLFLVGLALLLAAVAAAGIAASAAAALVDGRPLAPTLLQVGLLGLLLLAGLLVARTGLKGLRDRRLRNRRRLLRRLLRYLLRPIDGVAQWISGAASGGAAQPSRIGPAALLTAAVLGLAILPVLAAASQVGGPGAPGDTGASGGSGAPSIQPSPSADSMAAPAGPTVAPAGPASSLTPPSASPASTGSGITPSPPSSAEPTGTPAPTRIATPVPTASPPYRSPEPNPTPAVKPTPTPTPTPTR
jgi:hypothetical protein